MQMVPKRTVLLALLAALVLTGCNNNGASSPTLSSFICTPTTLPAVGGEVTLSWVVVGATSLSISGVGNVTPPTTGSTQVDVTVTTTFTLTATNFSGTSTATCQVTIGIVPTIISFTANPDKLDAGGGSTTLTWDVTGATELSIDQGVGIVNPVTTGSRSVLVGMTTVFTLTATNDAGSSSAMAQVDVPLPPPTTIVTGTVVDNDGHPVPGQTVLISGGSLNQSYVTDANGGFTTAPNVTTTPYNATIIQPTQAIQYLGLTRADPFLTVFLTIPKTESASLSGQFIGGSFPETASEATVFLFASPETIANLGDQPSGSYSSIPISWPGPSTTVGTLYALQIQTGSSGLPSAYPGYGTVGPVTLVNGHSTMQNVTLSAVTPGLVTGTVTLPTGYTILGKALALEVTPSVFLNDLVFDSSPNTNFSYVTPAITNTTLLLSASATSAAGEYSARVISGQSANGSGITLNIPSAPILLQPPDGGTIVPSTQQFSWTTYSGGVYEFQASPNGSGPTFYVLTAATTATLPDLSDAGLPVPASTEYSWQITGLAPVSSIDLLAAPGGIVTLSQALSESVSVTETFTTGP